MLSEFRDRFNSEWTRAKYAHFLELLAERCGAPVDFRICETPIFLPKQLLDLAVEYGRELYGQLANNREYHEASAEAIPEEFRTRNESPHPLFVQADFGLVREPDGTLAPKLVEIQGFPSIYAFQHVLADVYREAYGLDSRLHTLLGGLEEESFLDLFRRAVLGTHAPESVVLLEIDPFHQKTLTDFLLTRKLLGIRIADITQVEKVGRKLYFEGVEIRRIYNRVIVDEWVRRQIEPAFSFSDDLDVEWAGHPNWFFRLSKYSLPWFRHPSVPETHFLSDVTTFPDDLDAWVLKPLYSFAGLGVRIGPDRSEIEAIPANERRQYILQRRLDFVPTVNTPAGPTKIEIRVMYIWDGELKPVTTILRTGRGKMMGVDFNKNLEWVGASAGFYPKSPGL